LALLTYYILATVRAVLARVHGVGKIEAGLSEYYMVDEIQSTYRGMMIAVPPEIWSVFADCDRQQLAEILLDLAVRVHLKIFLKQPRASKKKKEPPPKRFTSPPCINCQTSQPNSADTLTRLVQVSPTTPCLRF